MKFHFKLSLVLGTLLAMSFAAESSEEGQLVGNPPTWVVNFSNLKEANRMEWYKNFQFAKQAYKEGNWLGCIGYINQCEMIYAKNPNVWNLRAACLIEQELYAEAEPYVKAAMLILPTDHVCLLNISSVYLGKRSYDQCASILETLLVKMPNHSEFIARDILIYRAFLCHMMLGNDAKAHALVADVDPMNDSPLYYYVQIAWALHLGDVDKACDDMRTVQLIFTNYPQLRVYSRSLDMAGLLEREK